MRPVRASWRHPEYLGLVCLILLAFGIRLYQLGRGASLTSDEVTTVTTSMHSVPEIWQIANKTPVQELWIRLGATGLGFGYTEFGVYFMSVVAGTLAVAAVYRLGKQLFARPAGLLGAFMLAFSAYHIYWSRSARYYALITLFSILAFFFLCQALQNNRFKAWAGYVVFRILALYTHTTVMLILAGEMVFAAAVLGRPLLRALWQHRLAALRQPLLLWQRRETWQWPKLARFAAVVLVVFLAFAPRWFPLVYNAYLGISGLRLPGAAVAQGVTPGVNMAAPLTIRWYSPFTVLYLFSSWNRVVHVLLLLLAGVSLGSCLARRQSLQPLFALAIWITPIAMLVAVSYRKPLNGRYLVSLLPLYYIVAGQGAYRLAQGMAWALRQPARLNKWVLWGSSATLVAVYATLSAPQIALTHWNVGENWRAVGRFLAQAAQPGQTILVAGTPVQVRALQYYLPEFTVVWRDPLVSYDILAQKNDFWLVRSAGTHLYQELVPSRYISSSIELIFKGGWYPDIAQTTELRPAQSWDLLVVYTSSSLTSTDQILELQQAWLAQADAESPGAVRRALTRAETSRRLDWYELAVLEYTQALAEGYVGDQLASYIYDARATCRYELGQTDLAVADWRQATARASWSKEPYEKLGRALARLGRAGEALALYQAAIAANPGRSWSHVLLGDFYQDSGSYQQAAAEYQRAIAIDSSDNLAYQRLGEMYAAEGQPYLVISLYQEAMQRNRWAGWPHAQLGQFYLSIGQVVQAIAEYQRAAEVQPQYGPIAASFLRDARWNLGAVVNSVRAYSDQGELTWWPGYCWVRPYPYDHEVVISRSDLAVEGQVRPGQLFIHPFGDRDNTYIEFEIDDNVFAYLDVGYGMADKASGLTNGVEYRIELRSQNTQEYEQLLAQDVTQSAWRRQRVSLLSYWGEDLDFRITVGANGDYAYDWLQTTFELVPPTYVVWNLSANLAQARFQPDPLLVKWRGDGFYTGGGACLISGSDLPAGGQARPGQVHFHPYSSEISSTLVFTLTNHPYHFLQTSYALADAAWPHSNGAAYTVSLSADGGLTFTDVVQARVVTTTWCSEIVNLPSSRDVVLKLSSSAMQDVTFDWLQVSLVLLPSGDLEHPALSSALQEEGR